MSTHTVHHGFSFSQLLGALNGPRATVRPTAATTLPSAERSDWLTRLATWAERQPAHHRLGSYMVHRR